MIADDTKISGEPLRIQDSLGKWHFLETCGQAISFVLLELDRGDARASKWTDIQRAIHDAMDRDDMAAIQAGVQEIKRLRQARG